MTKYNTIQSNESNGLLPHKKESNKSVLATIMLIICIVSFVLQTELAQYVQKSTSFSKPYFILYISHSCYIFMFPLEFVVQLIQQKRNNKDIKTTRELVSQSIDTTFHSFHQSLAELQVRINSQDSPIRFLVKISLSLAILLTLPSYIWYLSVNLTSMSNLTAIYNTGCFFAYLFSVLMLHDRVIGAKVGAVILCMVGVVVMAFWPFSKSNLMDQKDTEWFGIAVSTLGACFYGFYEVFYKKYASPSNPTILFANGLTGMIGIVTLLVLWIPFPFLHWSGIERFEFPDWETFGYILAIASMSVVYNATFMAVIALVNPVFAAVGVMLTIPAVAITDVFVTGVMVPLSTIVGSIFILVGFAILNRQVNQNESLEEQTPILN